MMGSTFRVGRIFGIAINVDASWFVIVGLITWSLAGHYFPMEHAEWSTGAYVAIGILTSLLFFASVLTHELAHGVVARAFGIKVRDITLFIFGGAARLERDPRRPREELLAAIVGPLTSLVIAGLFGAAWWASAGRNDPLHALSGWLAWINLLLGLFNLVPGFPLDGGRVLRAVVWAITHDARRATRVAAMTGQMFANMLIFWGIWRILGGDWINGVWIAVIGWFLRGAALDSVRVLALEDLLAGYTAGEAMMTDCPRLQRRLTLDVVVDQMLLPSGHHCFPVVEDERVAGILTLRRISQIPRGRWSSTRVEDAMTPAAELHTIRSDDGLAAVLERMMQDGEEQYPVVEDGRFLGLVGRDRLAAFVQSHAAAPSH